MSVYEIRKVNARRLIDERFGGVSSRFAKAINRSPNQVARWFMTGPESHRNIGEKLAREIERTLQLPERWMDTSHESEVLPVASEIKAKFSIPAEQLASLRMKALELALNIGYSACATSTQKNTADQIIADAKKFMAMILEEAR